MPPNRYHSNQRCDDKASASSKPSSRPVPSMAPAPHVSLAKVENIVNNIVHLALHQVNSNTVIMEVCDLKLKRLATTLRQQLTFDFLNDIKEILCKFCHYCQENYQQKSATIMGAFLESKCFLRSI